MSETTVLAVEGHVIAAVKEMGLITVSLFGAIFSGITALVGADGSNTIAIGTTLTVSVTFAGLILRMVVKNQSAIWDIVRSKDDELLTKADEIRQLKLAKEYVEWEREQARFRGNERTDPGMFTPSPNLLPLLKTTTRKSDDS